QLRARIDGEDVERIPGEGDDSIFGRLDDGPHFHRRPLQRVHHTVVVRRQLTNLGKWLDRRPQRQVLGARLRVHHPEQVEDLRRLAVFAHIEAGMLFLGRDPERQEPVIDPEEQETCPEYEHEADDDPETLYTELLPSTESSP